MRSLGTSSVEVDVPRSVLRITLGTIGDVETDVTGIRADTPRGTRAIHTPHDSLLPVVRG